MWLLWDGGRLRGELIEGEDAVLVDAAGGLRRQMLRGCLISVLRLRQVSCALGGSWRSHGLIGVQRPLRLLQMLLHLVLGLRLRLGLGLGLEL